MTNNVKGVVATEFLFNTAAGGVSLARVLDSIASLRLISSERNSRLFVTGYNTPGDGGGGHYWKDVADVTSADNGGTVIITNDGVRWKLVIGPEGISICQFGAVANGADCSVSINTALGWTRLAGYRLIAPAGKYVCNNPVNFYPDAPVGYKEISLIGDGKNSTVFDFIGAPAGTDSFIVNGGRRIQLHGFTVLNSRRVGLKTNPVLRGDPNYVSRMDYTDILVDASVSHGFEFTQAYVGTFKDLEATSNGGFGFKLNGSHDALTFINCWAGGDAASPNGGNLGGWYINGTIYSSFIGCASDWNKNAGYVFRNCNGVRAINCGSESNDREGFYVEASTSDSNDIPTVAQGIKGVSFEGCMGVNNSKLGINLYANLIGIRCDNAVNAAVTTSGCSDTNTDGSTVSVAVNGVSGTVNWTQNDDTLAGTVSKTGTVYRKNNTVAGRTCLKTVSANINIPNAVDTQMTFDVTSSNSLGATTGLSTITIPVGVSRIRVAAGIFWTSAVGGYRAMYIIKNGVGFAGNSQLKIENSTGFSMLTISSAIIEVNAGDTIAVVVNQNSGAILAAKSDNSTYFSVEAIG